MKRYLIQALFLLFALSAYSQNYIMVPPQGRTMVYSVNAKTPMGVSNMFVKQSIKSADEHSVILSMEASQSEDGEYQSSAITYALEDGYYLLSLKDALGEVLNQLQGKFEIVGTPENLNYPVTFDENSVFSDASMKIKANIQGLELTMDLSVRERAMIGKEEVQTPAGTFDCVKFVEKQVISIMGQEQYTQLTYWFGKDTGLVKQTTYAMGGLVASELLLKEIR